jgi:hypothetical protein
MWFENVLPFNRTPSRPIPEPPNDGPAAAHPKTNFLPMMAPGTASYLDTRQP